MPFYMPEFSSSKIIYHWFNVDNDEDELGMCYDMIIGCDLMVEFVLLDDIKCQVLQWESVKIPTKEPIGLLEQSDLTSCNMLKVVIQTAEPVSTREATKILAIIL